MTHTFLHTQEYTIIDDQPKILRLSYCTRENKPSVSIMRESTGTLVKDIQEAEQLFIDFILNNCENTDITSTEQEFIALNTNRCANQIANGTRRGSGNTIIINPTNIDKFEYLTNVMPDVFTIVTHDLVPENKIIVLYHGENNIDGLGIFSTRDQGNYLSLTGIKNYTALLADGTENKYTFPEIKEYARVITLI